MDIYHDIHHFLEIYEHIFFMGKLLIYSSIVKEVQKYENKINDIQVYWLHRDDYKHSSEPMHMLPSPLPHERQTKPCCSRYSRIRHFKAPKDHHTITATVDDEEKRRLEGSKSRDTNTDERRLDPRGSTNTDQITPSDDARRTVKRGLDEDNLKTRKFFR
jgi:hypothetical protein